MGKNRVAQGRIWQSCNHRHLHRCHDFPCFCAEYGEPKNAIALMINQSLDKAPSFRNRFGSQNHAEWDLRETVGNSFFLCLCLTQTDPGKLRVGEQREGHLATSHHAITTEDIPGDNLEIVFRNVSEMRTAGAIATCPNIR